MIEDIHDSDIISIMVISLSGICNISLICNLMCSEWRWLLFISWLGYLRYGLSSSVLYGITISSVNPSVYSLVCPGTSKDTRNFPFVSMVLFHWLGFLYRYTDSCIPFLRICLSIYMLYSGRTLIYLIYSLGLRLGS